MHGRKRKREKEMKTHLQAVPKIKGAFSQKFQAIHFQFVSFPSPRESF